MAELTKEWLKQTIAEYEANRDELPFGLDTNSAIELQAFKLALASLEADPVAYIFKHPAGKLFWALTDESNKDQSDVIPVYAAHPVPVVPAALPENDDEDGHDIDYLEPSEVYSLGRTAGWNACRAAMLQSGNFRENKNSSTNNFREIAETSTNYPVIPSEVLSAILKVAKIRADFDDFDGDRRGIGDCLDEAEQELIVTINKYASQLAAEPIAPNDVREQTAIPQVPVTPDGWIPVSERMPEPYEYVLVTDGFGDCDVMRVNTDGYWGPAKSLYPGSITHWMPLPAAPEQEVK
ncbi:TPA: DUF551 domain-containing protein [Escherichia coli]|nr:DUF551 domain-containing protein [Escherichia coli]EJC5006412.1 DUF551 domain-containing protein [Escherichia coli]HCN6774606.1 DUF551 domain-containing protein [Escherichia coli]HCN7642510.1 DUF551 domain-containing protein [Escherichia coli]HCN9372134.1 DUF551 domain-containing protein [Escherichia coli]